MKNNLNLFLEDAQEQLEAMENALVLMQEKGVNDEEVNTVFRAMHTIKGISGMFGFEEITNFTHEAESLLEKIRNNEIAFTDELLELFFKVKDHTQTLVYVATGDIEPNAAIESQTNELIAQLSKANNNTALIEEVEEETIAQEEKNLHLFIKLKEDFFMTGMDIIGIFEHLNIMGRVTKLKSHSEDVPLLDELNPMQCHMSYEIDLTTSEEIEAVESIFEYVMDDVELTIEENKPEEIKSQEKVLNEPLRDKEPVVTTPKKNFSLRIESSKIDQLMNQISEMVITNAKITKISDTLQENELTEAADMLSVMLEQIRSVVMEIRMVQVGDSFTKFKRPVYDMAKKLNKEVRFEILGLETELDKTVIEKISDPIIHMLRNSVDHGIETPEEREAAGKERVGTIMLNSYADFGSIVIEISDDGRGLDKEAIRKKAILNGLIKESDILSDSEIYALIFAAGVTTSSEVSDISGRGVGMDVVRGNIEELKGSVEIESVPAKGSTFRIRLPLTLAIIDGFLVQVGLTKYIIPLDTIHECLELDAKLEEQMKENEFIDLRGNILPLLNVQKHFHEVGAVSKRKNIVVVGYGNYRIGLVVDELFGEFQTVIKPLGEIFNKVPGINGGTILGDGEVALILDIPKLIQYKIKNTHQKKGSSNG
jgi:two-component system chemotaxis sensor kinase CheA